MSGLIPQHFIDDLIARADIVEVLGRRIQMKKAGKEYKACCPFHDEKTPSFTISPTKGFYHCFGCGAHGTALGFLMEHEHLSFVEAVESLANSMGIEVPRDEGQRPARRYDELFGLMGEIEDFYQSELRKHAPAVGYLKERGIDGPTAKRFGIGYAPAIWDAVLKRFGKTKEQSERLLAVGQIIRRDTGKHYDRFRDRVMFPIRDARGRCIGFGGRVMSQEKDDKQPKYLNTSDTVLFHKRQELYGLYEARQALRQIDRLLVVEGYMDVVGLARHGIDYAVATLGTATTDEHLNRLFRLCDEVNFCFDGDRAGRDAAWKALETALPHVKEGRQIRFVFLPDGQDPDSYVKDHGSAAFEDVIGGGVALSDFLINQLSASVDMTTVDGRARLAELARPLMAQISNGIYKELLMSQLAEVIGMPEHKLAAILSSQNAASLPQSLREQGLAKVAAKINAGNRPSVVRRAMTLLLHQPSAAMTLNVEDLASVTRRGAALLQDLIETVQADPTLTTAGILERWRTDEEGRHLGKLASIEVPDDNDFDVAAELADCVRQLNAMAVHDRFNFLIEKQKLTGLSAAELEEFRTLSRNNVSNG